MCNPSGVPTIWGLILSVCILKYSKQVTNFTIVRNTFFSLVLKKKRKNSNLYVLNRCETLEDSVLNILRVSSCGKNKQKKKKEKCSICDG